MAPPVVPCTYQPAQGGFPGGTRTCFTVRSPASRAGIARSCLSRCCYLDSGFARRGELIGHWRSARHDWCVLVMFQRQPRALFELGVFAETIAHWGHDLNGRTATLDELRDALSTAGFAGAEWGDAAGVPAQLHARLRELLPPVAVRPTAASSATPSRTAIYVLDGQRFERDWLFLPSQVDGDWWQLHAARAATAQALLDESFPLTVVEPGMAWPQAAGLLLWTVCCGECSIGAGRRRRYALWRPCGAAAGLAGAGAEGANGVVRVIASGRRLDSTARSVALVAPGAGGPAQRQHRLAGPGRCSPAVPACTRTAAVVCGNSAACRHQQHPRTRRKRRERQSLAGRLGAGNLIWLRQHRSIPRWSICGRNKALLTPLNALGSGYIATPRRMAALPWPPTVPPDFSCALHDSPQARDHPSRCGSLRSPHPKPATLQHAFAC